MGDMLQMRVDGQSSFYDWKPSDEADVLIEDNHGNRMRGDAVRIVCADGHTTPAYAENLSTIKEVHLNGIGWERLRNAMRFITQSFIVANEVDVPVSPLELACQNTPKVKRLPDEDIGRIQG